MPYICFRRTDIPEGTLQVTDLWPNTSLRSIYDPPGQTKYIRQIQNDTVATSGTTTLTTIASYSGLAAYLLDTIEDGGNNDSLTAAQANTIAAALVARVRAGSAMTLSAVNTVIAATVASSGIGVGTSIATLADVLKICAGGEYVLPAGSVIQTSSTFIAVARGAFTTGTYRGTYDTGALAISLGEGQLAGYTASTFSYGGSASAALVVYDDTGAVM